MGITSSFHSVQSKDANIELDDACIYNPGDIVSGTLHLEHKDAHNEPVSIDLIGEFGFRLTYPSVFNPTDQAANHRIPFFKISTLSIMNGEKFALRLDEQLPPAVNLMVESYTYIQYYLTVHLSKKTEHRHYIIVCPRVSIPHFIVESQDFDAASHKEIHLSGSLDRNWILPGQTLNITFQVKNPHHKHISHINGNIFMKAEFKRGECTEKVMDFTVNNATDTNDEHIHGALALVIPSRYLPPTFTYTNNKHHFDVDISYWIVISMHIRGVLHTISTTIPLSMGFEPENMTLNEQYNANCHRAFTFFA